MQATIARVGRASWRAHRRIACSLRGGRKLALCDGAVVGAARRAARRAASMHAAMDPAEAAAMRAALAQWAEAELAPHVCEWDEAEEIPRSVYEAAGAVGLLGAGYPAHLGGTPMPLSLTVRAQARGWRCIHVR